MSPQSSLILVTGATGFIGAHVVDALLERGLRVRGATRSLAKGEKIVKARPQYSGMIEFVKIQDFENPAGLEESVRGVDGIIHVASPLTYQTTDNENELILPAIKGTQAVLKAAMTEPKIRRVVMTSSFASVVDINRKGTPYFVYTADDWNPLSYEEAIHPRTSSVVAYRGSKKFAELAAWDFVKQNAAPFDLITLCPPMTFGPLAHPVENLGSLNESSAALWRVACGTRPLPTVLVPFWIDVRDLAKAHVEALLVAQAGNKRYTLASPDSFSYTLAAQIFSEEFPEFRERIHIGDQAVDTSHGLDGQTAANELGIQYRSFRDTLRDFGTQLISIMEDTKSTAN